MRRIAIGVVVWVVACSEAAVVAHWRLDETDAATNFPGDRIDSSSNAIDLPLTGDASQGGSWSGGTAMLVTGASTSYRNSPAVASHIAGDFSFSMFVDPYATDAGAYLLQLTDGFEVRLKSFSGGALFDMIVKTPSSAPYVRSAYLAGGTKEPAGGGNESVHMYHLAGTYDAATGELALYLDGAKTTTASAGGVLRNPGTFYLGETTSQPSLVGLYDDVQLYDEVLAESQISFLRTHPGSVIQSGSSYYWNAQNGYWDTPLNWADGSVPDADALVFVTNGTLKVDTGESLDFLGLDDCELQLLAGGLSMASNLVAGSLAGSTVKIDQTGGTLDVGGELSLCHNTPASMKADYAVSGGQVSIGGNVEIGGYNNNGTWIQSGGEVSIAGSLSCGRDGGFGVFEISGGSLSVGGFTAIKDGEFRVMGSHIDSVTLDRLDMENEPCSIFVVGIDEGGVTTVDVVGSYLKLDGARIRVEPMPGYAGRFGDTFDIFRIPASKTIKLANTEVESTMGQKFTASIETVGAYKVIRLAVSSHSVPMTVFRYRSYQGNRPASVSALVSSIPHDASSSSIISSERGHGFNDFLYTRFNGSDYLRAMAAVNTIDELPRPKKEGLLFSLKSSPGVPSSNSDTNHSDSFTLESWFMADSVSGTQTLFSTTDHSGVSLKIVDGALEGLVYLRNTAGTSVASESLRGGTLSLGVWYHAAFVAREDKQTGQYNLRLYLDEEPTASKTVASLGGLVQSRVFPMVGAQPSAANQPVGEYFTGRIHATTLANYAKSEFFLQSHCPRDGSGYLGLSNEHDYLSPVKGFDLRIDETIAPYPDVASIEKRYLFPLIDDGYVPQAVATVGTNRIYVSCFWYDVDLSKHEYSSVLAELTPEGRLLRVMPLFHADGTDLTWHTGGIASYDGHIYIASGHDICRFTPGNSSTNWIDPETLARIRHDATPLFCDATYTLPDLGPNSAMSGISIGYDSDGTPLLWSMQFSRDVHKHIVAHVVSADGSIDPGQSPRYTFELPTLNTQGIVCHQVSSTQVRFYLSQSSGDHPSYIYDVLYNKNAQSVVSSSTLYTLPAGVEGLALLNGKIWTVAESGSKVFQKRTEDYWRQMFPYLFAIPF